MDEISVEKFLMWARSLPQDRIDYLYRMDRSYPGFAKHALRKMQNHNIIDEKYQVIR